MLAGGSLDPGEAWGSAATREMFEETGLEGDPSSYPSSALPILPILPVALWESAYPTSPADFSSHPRPHHHLIVYFLVRVRGHCPAVKVSEQEVDAACWVPVRDVPAVCCSVRQRFGLPSVSCEWYVNDLCVDATRDLLAAQ